MTHTKTFARIDRTTRDTIIANGDMRSFTRRATEGEAFYLATGYYRVTTISGDVDVTAPTWIVFDDEGWPYPVEPSIFEKVWSPNGSV